MNDEKAQNKRAGQLVTFWLGEELFGIDISAIREVIHYTGVTAIPDSPPFVEGVIEVRDQVVPVVNLKERLHITQESGDSRRRVVILELDGRPLGGVVDDIAKVVNPQTENVETLPDAVVGNSETNCISHLIKIENGLVIVIDPSLILNREELRELSDLEQKAG